jgi:hypothetical protein
MHKKLIFFVLTMMAGTVFSAEQSLVVYGRDLLKSWQELAEGPVQKREELQKKLLKYGDGRLQTMAVVLGFSQELQKHIVLSWFDVKITRSTDPINDTISSFDRIARLIPGKDKRKQLKGFDGNFRAAVKFWQTPLFFALADYASAYDQLEANKVFLGLPAILYQDPNIIFLLDKEIGLFKECYRKRDTCSHHFKRNELRAIAAVTDQFAGSVSDCFPEGVKFTHREALTVSNISKYHSSQLWTFFH